MDFDKTTSEAIEDAAQAAIRAGCSEGRLGIYDPCRYPDCECDDLPRGIRAALRTYAAKALDASRSP